MLKENFHVEQTVEEVIESIYDDFCNECDLLADRARDFIYITNGYLNDKDIAKRRYNDDTVILDIYDRISWIKENIDRVKTHYELRKREKESKEEEDE